MAEQRTGRRRLAVVTGGAGGIGEAITRSLHEDGWGVAIGYVTRSRADALAAELDEPGAPAVTVPMDMTDGPGLAASIARLLDDFGRVDAVVFNSGAARTAHFVDTTEQDWEHELEVNFLGAAAITKLVLPAMLAAGRGVLVGITSDSAKVGDVGHAPYAAGKGALSSFLKTVVREHGSRGVRASCVAPGPIDTRMLRDAFGSEDAAEKAIAKLIRLVPVGRLGTPAEVAAAVRFLCSDATYVAGEHLSVGGGVTMNA
jgi:2-hydroxycyclohexanecarboxyl-CoA dehydrogenase